MVTMFPLIGMQKPVALPIPKGMYNFGSRFRNIEIKEDKITIPGGIIKEITLDVLTQDSHTEHGKYWKYPDHRTFFTYRITDKNGKIIMQYVNDNEAQKFFYDRLNELRNIEQSKK